jgi:hypothetical protein
MCLFETQRKATLVLIVDDEIRQSSRRVQCFVLDHVPGSRGSWPLRNGLIDDASACRKAFVMLVQDSFVEIGVPWFVWAVVARKSRLTDITTESKLGSGR